MKINWGTGIVLAFIGFISFIMYFVIQMNVDEKLSYDLVTEDYYGKELEFQEDLDKQEHAKSLTTDVTWTRTNEGLLISFPLDKDIKDITGKVFLYRPSNKQLDYETSISLSNHNLLVPDKRLVDGRWNISVDWQYQGNSYLYKKEIRY